MGKWCFHASLFLFDRIIIKVAGNQDRHKSSDEYDFGLNQTTHFGVTCPWVTKISHFWTWISLKPVDPFKLDSLDKILSVASLGWGKGCIRFWGRLDQNSGVHGNKPAPIGHLVECLLRGTGGHGFDPGPRHNKVVKNGTSCSSLGTQIYGVELGLVDPVSG